MPRVTPEGALLRDSKRYLTILERENVLTFNRVFSGPVIVGKGKYKRMVPNPNAGHSDLEIIYRGQIAYIELKSAKGSLSDKQQLFLARMAKFGAKTAVIRTVLELISFLLEELKLNPQEAFPTELSKVYLIPPKQRGIEH